MEALNEHTGGYKSLEVLGPEHEFSIVDGDLRPQPVVDKLIEELGGTVSNEVFMPSFVFGKELQKHVVEFKALKPFHSPSAFEETMQGAVLEITDILDKWGLHLLGTGMHPTLDLREAEVWDHQDREVYDALDRLFDLRQHGWLNIQSFQLNVSYLNESEGVSLYNVLRTILPYLPAISASSPIYDSKIGDFIDNRLHFYRINQELIPSITGDIIPKPINSFKNYRELTINRYSSDLKSINAPECILNKEWINSRGVTLRFNRKALEIRVFDEQECVKSDVAISCFTRSLLRGLMKECEPSPTHPQLVRDLEKVVREGLDAKIDHPRASTARELCSHLLKLADEHATKEERRYLWVIKKRIEEGNLSHLLCRHVHRSMKKTDLNEAILKVYSRLERKLRRNEIYS